MSFQASYFRGPRLFQVDRIKRFRYLLVRSIGNVWESRQKAKGKLLSKSGSDPRPDESKFNEVHPSCLFRVYSDASSGLKWAPRDSMEHASSTLAEWRSHGYGSYEMLLSLIGANVDQKALLDTNKFVWIGYSYLHLSFDRFVSVLRRLEPSDRFFCFMIPLGVPVHMYFDIDGDFGEFPALVDQDEACLNVFLREVRELFRELFQREMDCSGLVLLQATSATKLSWHLHVQSEAFRDVHHMKRFVLRLNERLALKKGSSILINPGGKSLVDPAPYMDRQNFRAPYCCKPGKMALLPRTFDRNEFVGTGEIRLEAARPSAELHANIDEELLWRCHPALAQPGPGYTYLELAAPVVQGQKRKVASDALTTSNRARKLEGVLDAASASSRTIAKLPKDAAADSCRLLTAEEEIVVRSALQVSLGSAVELDSSCYWYRSLNRGEVTVCGVCVAGTARCVKSSAAAGMAVVHRRNRMAFRLQASGCISVRCFKCDQGKPSHSFDWKMILAVERELMSVASNIVHIIEPSASSDSVLVADSAPSEKPRQQLGLTVEERLIDYIRKVISERPLASIFSRNVRQKNGCSSRSLAESEEFELFQSVVMFDSYETVDSTSSQTGLSVTSSELYERFCSFKEKVEDLQANFSRSWRAVHQICERYLDPSHPVVHHLFATHTHLALESGQGTNKTGLIFAMLLILLLKDPKLRALILSNRKTFASTVRERGQAFDRDISSAFGVELGFRSYTEESFRLPSKKAFEGSNEAYERAVNDANRRLAAAPRLILSVQSLGRLFAVTSDNGVPLIPYYDVIIPDEFMELLSIFYGSTMHEKRRMGLQYTTSLMTRAKCVWVADAGIVDETALPLLKGLTGGVEFIKLQNTAKTIQRQYLRYDKLASWRIELLQQLKQGRKVFVACNTKAQVESIVNDPGILQLGIRLKGLHSDSPSVDRKEYINSVARWTELDLLVYSPVISHGVNFDEVHFDVAFLYASDNSTTAVQTFQQLNRARQIRSNNVHVFIDAHPKLYEHLPCSYDDLKAELNEEVRKFNGDWFARCVKSVNGKERSIRLPLVDQWGPAPKCVEGLEPAGRDIGSGRYVLDTGVDATSCVRSLFDSIGNELYLRIQVAINRSRVRFEELLLQEFTSAGGVVLSVLDPDAGQSKKHGKAIKEADIVRKEAGLLAILNAPDVVCKQELERLRWRRQVHDLKAGELEQLQKAEWKETYGVALSNVDGLHAVDDFVTRFGNPRRLQQAQQLQSLCEERKAVVRLVSAASDPIGYLARESNYRDHVDLILQSAGFKTCLDERVVVAAEQQLLMQPGHAHRRQLLDRWEQVHLDRKGWWIHCKKENGWTVQGGELEANGEAVTAAALFQAFLSGCRQFIGSNFGIKVASGRLRLPGGSERSYIYQLNRTHWNEFSKRLIGLAPQALDTRVKSGKAKAKSTKFDMDPSGLSDEFSLERSMSSNDSMMMDVSNSSSAASAPDSDVEDSISAEELSELVQGLDDRRVAIVRRLHASCSDSEDVSPSMVRALARSMRRSSARGF